MKIGPFDLAPKPTSTAAPARGTAPEAAATPTPDASAKVALSSAATSALQGAASQDFDAAKVERIAQAIRDGNFKVDADAIADKLLAESRERLAPPTH